MCACQAYSGLQQQEPMVVCGLCGLGWPAAGPDHHILLLRILGQARLFTKVYESQVRLLQDQDQDGVSGVRLLKNGMGRRSRASHGHAGPLQGKGSTTIKKSLFIWALPVWGRGSKPLPGWFGALISIAKRCSYNSPAQRSIQPRPIPSHPLIAQRQERPMM